MAESPHARPDRSAPTRVRPPIYDQAMQWLSRTISILVVMVGPALFGRWLDTRYQTQFLALIGLVAGLILSTCLLLLLANKLTPPAGGEPIPYDDDDQEQDPPT